MVATSGPPSRRLLIIGAGRALAELFTARGYAVELAREGRRGLHLGLTREFDVLIVERGLPGLDGVELLLRLRSRAVTVPVLMLADPGTVAERVRGLDAGADDYLVRPFDPEELLARVRALHRRALDYASLLPLGNGWLDTESRVVRMPSGEHVALSARECRLLSTLAARPKHVHTRDSLRRRVFNGAQAESIVDTYVYYLRNKLGATAIRTIRGVGYRVGEL